MVWIELRLACSEVNAFCCCCYHSLIGALEMVGKPFHQQRKNAVETGFLSIQA